MATSNHIPPVGAAVQKYTVGYGCRVAIYLIDGAILLASFLVALVLAILTSEIEFLISQAIVAA